MSDKAGRVEGVSQGLGLGLGCLGEGHLVSHSKFCVTMVNTGNQSAWLLRFLDRLVPILLLKLHFLAPSLDSFYPPVPAPLRPPSRLLAEKSGTRGEASGQKAGPAGRMSGFLSQAGASPALGHGQVPGPLWGPHPHLYRGVKLIQWLSTLAACENSLESFTKYKSPTPRDSDLIGLGCNPHIGFFFFFFFPHPGIV